MSSPPPRATSNRLRSMTGYGTGSAPCVGGVVAAEVRTVNHKYCDVKLRMPRDFNPIEARILTLVRGRLLRGHAEVSLRWSETPPGRDAVRADIGLAKAYARAYEDLKTQLGLGGGVDLALLAQHGIVEAQESSHTPDDLWPGISKALGSALDACVAMREIEGDALAADVRARAAGLAALREDAVVVAPRVQAEGRERFKERIAVLALGTPIDPTRLAQEAAFLAERADVSEELSRLQSHLHQLGATLGAKESIGRKLDFLCQELHREINTVGSKSQHVELTRIVVDFKSELEKLREQVQNIE